MYESGDSCIFSFSQQRIEGKVTAKTATVEGNQFYLQCNKKGSDSKFLAKEFSK